MVCTDILTVQTNPRSGITGLDHHREVGLLIYKSWEKLGQHIWYWNDTHRHLLLLPCLVLTVNVQVWQLWYIRGIVALRDKGLVYQIKKDSQEEEKFTVGSGERNVWIPDMTLGLNIIADEINLMWKTCRSEQCKRYPLLDYFSVTSRFPLLSSWIILPAFVTGAFEGFTIAPFSVELPPG